MSTDPEVGVDRRPLERRHFYFISVALLLLSFVQSPGRIAADTKYDLTENPLGFFARAAHLWSSQAPLGQVQNQAYGYFFPHGTFFSAGHILSIPPWITQRLWWAILLIAGFWGAVRLAEALDIGSRGSRILAAIAFALSPRILTTLGPISSESLPMMLAPWVLLPLVKLWNGNSSPRRAAAHSAVAVALMGSVNAVATVAACVPAGIWWMLTKPDRTWARFTGWWVLCLALASLWWLVPLLLLGHLSPPFLDFIESAGVTTQWNSLVEVLRGTDNWTSFVSPERIAGSVLITQPDTVLATGAVAAAGLAGLTMRSMPARGRLVVILMTGVVILACGYAGALGSPLAEPIRYFLDNAGAPLRNVHKFDPLIRLPIALGLAHLLGRVAIPMAVPWRRFVSDFSNLERNRALAGASLLMVALVVATAVAWTGRLAPRGTYEEVPQYWHDTADWLATNAPDTRALVVPGSPFGSQSWGLTRDEPLQALASSPWAVRDAIPLNPPGAIRALDAVQRLFADGQPSPTLAAALRSQGFGYLVVRNDLDADTSNSTRPLLVHHALDGSPGLRKVAEFGERPDTILRRGVVYDSDLLPPYRPIEIYAVEPAGADSLNPTAPYTVDLDSLPVVAGGPEALARMGTPTALLASDARTAGLAVNEVIVTDTPRNREIDYGRVDNHSSALRSSDDPRRTLNIAPDYPVPGAAVISASWTGAEVTVSSSASDATQLGGVAPSSSTASAFDGDPGTSWISEGNEGAIGEWLQLDLKAPITSGLLDLVVSPGASGAPANRLEITTDVGSTRARVPVVGAKFTVPLPPGKTTWIRITAVTTADGSIGNQFGLSEVKLRDFSDPDNPKTVPIRQRFVVPARGSVVLGWDLAQELPGRPACYEGEDRVRCSPALLLAPEEEHFRRVLEVPEPITVNAALTVRSRASDELESLLKATNFTAEGLAFVTDLRGSAYAAADGDVRTTWTARDANGPRPTLTIVLPKPTLVSGIRLTRSPGPLPPGPSQVSINLGAGPQTRTVPSSSTATLAVFPQVTDKIEITLNDWQQTLDRTSAGFVVAQAPGIAEIALISDGKVILPATPPSDQVIEISCDEGPVIKVGNTAIPTRVRATVAQLKSNAVLTAEPCEGASAQLLTGTADVEVETGPLFVTDRLTLDAGIKAPDPVHHEVDATEWTNSHRVVEVERSDQESVLVIPESTNVGWSATSNGQTLRAITVNGWQQGWIVPAGATQVTLDFALDRWYRVAIFGGLLLLIPLFAIAFLGGKPRRTPPLRPVSIAWLGAVAFVAACGIVSGVAGAAFASFALVAVPWLRQRFNWAVPVLTASSLGLAVALLSRSPWQSRAGYIGHSAFVQFPALLALVLTGASAVGAGWFFSQRRAASRNGSSTSA